SNYGFHVDVSAPGTKILGTWPSNKRSRFFTQDDGYEYMSGTSQAAPHVTGVLARLLNLGFSPSQSKVKLLKGARPKTSQRENFIRHGNVDLKRSVEAPAGSFIYPANKSDALVKWEESAQERSFVLKLKNLGESANNVTVNIKKARGGLQKDLKVLTNSFSIKSLAPAETFEKRVFIKAPFKGHGEFLFQIEIVSDDERKTYFFQAKAVNIVDGKTQRSNQEELPITNPVDLKNSVINKFDNYTDRPGVDLLVIKSSGKHTLLGLLKQEGARYSQSAWQKIPVKSPIFLNLSKVDVDLDGEAEYVAALVNIEDRENRETRFFVFDQGFNPKRITIAPKNAFDNKLAVMPGSFKWARRGDKKVPAWVGVGKRPESERPAPGPWESPVPEKKINRLFVLTPSGLKTEAFEGEEEIPLHILYPGQDSKTQGSLTVITGNSYGFYKSYATYVYKNSLKKINEFELFPYIDLLNAKPLPM
ncbi:MAG: S8 family serine peptidase, partial [Bacteriovoracaceae bacterium]